jgi:hypothetical protein
MSFTLYANNGDDLRLTSWSYRPFLEILRGISAFDVSKLDQLMDVPESVEISEIEATQAANLLAEYVTILPPNIKRIMYDLSEVETEDDGTFYRDDLGKNYSIPVQTLKELAEFMRSSGGFHVS